MAVDIIVQAVCCVVGHVNKWAANETGASHKSRNSDLAGRGRIINLLPPLRACYSTIDVCPAAAAVVVNSTAPAPTQYNGHDLDCL